MPTIQRTLRILDFIRGYIAVNDEAPLIREIADHFNMSSFGSVHAHLKKMVDKGWIRIIPNVSRGIRIVEQEQKNAA